MGIHLGFDAPSSAVVCLALRHAILPKQLSLNTLFVLVNEIKDQFCER